MTVLERDYESGRCAAGHINHSLFWKNLAPQAQGGGELAAGPLKDALVADFGSVDGESRFVAYRRSSPPSCCVSLGCQTVTQRL